MVGKMEVRVEGSEGGVKEIKTKRGTCHHSNVHEMSIPGPDIRAKFTVWSGDCHT